MPALEQSYTKIEGEPIQDCKSYKLKGMYCVYVRLNTQISPLAKIKITITLKWALSLIFRGEENVFTNRSEYFHYLLV